jgi:hypothetical protein
MPKKLDPKIAEVLKEYGFGPDACWDCHGTWVVYHKVLEQIAANAGIGFDMPEILEARSADKIVAICVAGQLGDKREWSIGEAAPGNNKNSYPWAMAEKRAKDRVILKLIGLHGFAYSEDEADDFKESRPKEKPLPSGALNKTAARAAMQELSVLIHDDEQTPTVEMLDAHLADHKDLIEQVARDWPEWIHGMENNRDFVGFNERIHDRREVLTTRDAENIHPETQE